MLQQVLVPVVSVYGMIGRKLLFSIPKYFPMDSYMLTLTLLNFYSQLHKTRKEFLTENRFLSQHCSTWPEFGKYSEPFVLPYGSSAGKVVLSW